jgi:CBS domain-containing protein
MPIQRILRRSVKTLPPETSCAEAARLMRDEEIGCVVVAEAGRPAGVVTDRDLVVRVMAAGEDPDRLALRDVMSGEPVFLGDERSLDAVIRTMREQGVRRVPVVDEEGELEGIVSLDDLLVLLAEQLGSLAETVRQELVGRV